MATIHASQTKVFAILFVPSSSVIVAEAFTKV